jgi:hypothetical protein
MSELQPAHAPSANNPISQNVLFIVCAPNLSSLSPTTLFHIPGYSPWKYAYAFQSEIISNTSLNVNKSKPRALPIMQPKAAENPLGRAILGLLLSGASDIVSP